MAIFFICRNNLADLKKKKILKNKQRDRGRSGAERNSNRRSRSDTQINNNEVEEKKEKCWGNKEGTQKRHREIKWLNDKYFRLGRGKRRRSRMRNDDDLPD
jgi:hypothetical protein